MGLHDHIRNTFNTYQRIIRNYLTLVNYLLDAIESGKLEKVRQEIPALRKRVAETQARVRGDL